MRAGRAAASAPSALFAALLERVKDRGLHLWPDALQRAQPLLLCGLAQILEAGDTELGEEEARPLGADSGKPRDFEHAGRPAFTQFLGRAE